MVGNAAALWAGAPLSYPPLIKFRNLSLQEATICHLTSVFFLFPFGLLSPELPHLRRSVLNCPRYGHSWGLETPADENNTDSLTARLALRDTTKSASPWRVRWYSQLKWT